MKFHYFIKIIIFLLLVHKETIIITIKLVMLKRKVLILISSNNKLKYKIVSDPYTSVILPDCDVCLFLETHQENNK